MRQTRWTIGNLILIAVAMLAAAGLLTIVITGAVTGLRRRQRGLTVRKMRVTIRQALLQERLEIAAELERDGKVIVTGGPGSLEASKLSFQIDYLIVSSQADVPFPSSLRTLAHIEIICRAGPFRGVDPVVIKEPEDAPLNGRVVDMLENLFEEHHWVYVHHKPESP